MAGSINIVIVGTPVADPEMRYLDSGIAVATVRFAINEPTSRDTRKTTWARVTFWRDQAERLVTNVKKGTPVMIVANFVESRPWTDNAGKPQVSTEFSGISWNFAGNRDSNPAAESASGGSEPATDTTTVDDIPF